ncbi:MAG: ABC transporter permease [Actinobacteria bacterium]|nr:ABC transporter permease [Actinomycetota bacterium]
MRRIIRTGAFVRKEIMQVLRQPGLMVSLVLGPFAILLLFGSGLREEDPAVKTIFVVPSDSRIAQEVEQFAQAQSERLTVEGVQQDEEDALRRLRRGDVQMVLVFPENAEGTIRGGEQAQVNVYHDQIDPLETQAIQLFTRTGVDEINQQVLRELVRSGQEESADVDQRLAAAKASVDALNQQLSGDGDAQQQLQLAQGDLAGLALALGPSLAVLGGIQETSGPGESAALLEAYQAFTASSDQLGQANDASSIDAQQVSQLADELDTLEQELETFQSLSPEVIVSPFAGSAQRVVEGSVQLVDFYAPAVLALLVQHMVVTFVALSIVRERELGTNELFRAAPVTTAEMVIGKYVAFAIMGAVIATALVLGLIYSLGVPMVGSWPIVLTTIGLLLLASTGLGFLVALAANTDSQAVQYAMLLLLASIFFSGFLLSLERFRPVLTWLARVLPVTSGVVLLRDEMLRGQLTQPLHLTLLAVLAVILFVAAWRLFRRRLYAS